MNSSVSILKQITSLLSLLVIAVLFQNCDFVSDDLDAGVDARDQSSADAMPFAFDLDIDQIAYMSCQGEDFSEPFFSFRAGGYKNGSGVKFRESFLESYGEFSTSRLQTLLSLSTRNTQTGVVMSVRDSGLFQNVSTFGADESANPESIEGRAVAGLMFDELQTYTDSDVLDSMLDQRFSSTNYLRGMRGLSSLRSFDGSISLFSLNDDAGSLPSSVNFADLYRDNLQDQSYLSFTFATAAETDVGQRARSPFTSTGESVEGQASVWGKGYQFNFSEYDNYVSTGFRSSSSERAVTDVRAFDLETESSLGESWVCPNDQKYVIVRQADATRRYDGQTISTANHPFNGYDRVDPEDQDSALDTVNTNYDDGGPDVGGYYFTYEADYDGNGDLDFVRHKVICPLVSDQIPPDTALNQDERDAWERVRSVLPVEDWYVFRGSKYNCVVPKNASGDTCYAGGVNINDGTDHTEPRNLIQYFADEDHPDIRIFQERLDQSDGDGMDTILDIQVTRDCGPGSSTSHGGFNYCPQVVSICYRLN